MHLCLCNTSEALRDFKKITGINCEHIQVIYFLFVLTNLSKWTLLHFNVLIKILVRFRIMWH